MPETYIWRLQILLNNVDSGRNYLSKFIDYAWFLEATNNISHLDEFVAAILACWEKKVPFETYNVTNPGHVITREIVELIKESGGCKKEFRFFDSEADFMGKAAKTPRSNCLMSSKKLIEADNEMTPIRDAIRNSLALWNKS